jgi:hypothetical protein
MVKGGGLASHPHQAGLIFQSWWNVRQKVAFAILLTLWLQQSWVWCVLVLVCVRLEVLQSPNYWMKSRQKYWEFSSMLFSHLYSFALRFLFLQTHAVSVKRKRGKIDRKHYPLPYRVRNPYRTLKSENSQDYVQKPQWNCAFMNSASVLFICKPQSNRGRSKPGS